MADARKQPERRPWWRRRRLRWSVGLAGFGLLLAVATLDLWAPPLAEAWAGGVRHESRTVRPFDVVFWEKAAWENGRAKFTAGAVSVSAPWAVILEGRADAHLHRWTLELKPAPTTAAQEVADAAAKAAEAKGAKPGADDKDGELFGWPELARVLLETGAQLNRWVGEVEWKDGRVLVAGEDVRLPRGSVEGGVMRGSLAWRGRGFRYTADLAAGELRLLEGASGAELVARISETRVSGELSWAGNRAPFAAQGFAPGSWLPAEFVCEASDWRVPAARLGAAGAYGDLRGGFVLRRAGEALDVAVNAAALPREDDLPVIEIALGGEARPDRVRVERFTLTAPALRARLSAPLEWRAREGWDATEEPVFAWEAELGELSGGRVRGRLDGAARWFTGPGGWRIAWDARAADAAWEDWAGVQVALRGETNEVSTRLITATLTSATEDRLEARGVFSHADRWLNLGPVRASVGGERLRRWLPEGLALGRVTADVAAQGRWPQMRLTGEAAATGLRFRQWAADELSLSGSAEREAASVELMARRGEATMEGSANWKAADAAVTVTDLALRRPDGGVLRSEGDIAVALAAGRRAAAAELRGPDETALRLRWDEAERSAELQARALDSGWLRPWWTGGEWPELRAPFIDLKGRLTEDGWLEGGGLADVDYFPKNGLSAWIRTEGTLGAEGLRLTRLEAGRGADTLANGSGLAPWRARWGDGRIEPAPVAGGEWSLRLRSRANAELWNEYAALVGVELTEPDLAVALRGPAEAPRGELSVATERLALRGEGLPDGGLELRDLRLEAVVAREELKIARLGGTLDGQQIEAAGRLGMAEGDWARLRARPYVWLRDHAEARVTVPSADVAALARYLPTLLAPTGRLEAELVLSPGAKLDGRLLLKNGATRPLGGFGVLQEIDVELALSGLDVEVRRMRAVTGGQELVVSGRARRTPGKIPALDLTAKAERFPLVRRPGLLMRGDLDLTVKTDEAGRTQVGGRVGLRDSLFLADIRPLIAGPDRSAAAVRSRPPYFSVAAAPLADWTLALRVEGEEFLRLRTPVFEGLGSARFDLAGTFREPRATGEFRVERGTILFPFASFAVQEGAVRLRTADPYTPVLDFRATGRRLGYDLRLELRGTADAPQLELFSSPPLEAEDLILMVTAGVAPREGAGTTASGTQRLAAVGAYVGRDLLRTLGLGGSDEERLTISSGEKVSRAGRETYGFDFKLNDRWSLTGEYDEFDAYNVGVRRRLQAAEPEGASAPESADAPESASKPEQEEKEGADAR